MSFISSALAASAPDASGAIAFGKLSENIRAEGGGWEPLYHLPLLVGGFILAAAAIWVFIDATRLAKHALGAAVIGAVLAASPLLYRGLLNGNNDILEIMTLLAMLAGFLVLAAVLASRGRAWAAKHHRGAAWRSATPLAGAAVILLAAPYVLGYVINSLQPATSVTIASESAAPAPVPSAPPAVAPVPAPAAPTEEASSAPSAKIIWDEPGIRFSLSRLTYDPEDEAELGQVYENGVGVEQSYAEAARWYRAAAEQGDAIAQRHLAEMYYTPRGVPQDFREAYKWYRKAALQGDPDAQKAMSEIFAKGKGKRRDNAEAYLWQQLWLKAEPQEAAHADNIAALLTPEEKSSAEAALKDWKPDPDVATPLRMRADKGDARAQMALGLMYARGQGIPHDDAQAAQWMKKAAEHGLAHAQEFLGNMYETGQGVKQDYAEAYFWYRLASHTVEDGVDVSMADADFSKVLTAQQRAAVETRVKNWRPVDSRPSRQSDED